MQIKQISHSDKSLELRIRLTLKELEEADQSNLIQIFKATLDAFSTTVKQRKKE